MYTSINKSKCVRVIGFWVLLTGATLHAQVPWFDWIRSVTAGDTSSSIEPSSSAVDASGDILVTGNLSGAVAFGTDTFLGPGIFIARYDSNGSLLWEREGVSSGGGAWAIAVDTNGNAYVTGNFVNTISFGAISATASGVADMFLVKYDPRGNPLWVQTLHPANNQASGQGVLVDKEGNVLVAGTLIATDFQPFLAKFDSDGNQLPAPPLDATYGFAGPLAIDRDGNYYLGGSFIGTLTFEGGFLTSSGSGNTPWIAKLAPDGKLSWAWHGLAPSTSTSVECKGIAVADNGDVYTTGRFLGSVYFGDFALRGSANWNMYASKHSAAGVVQWANGMPGQGTSVCVDRFGNSYMTGLDLLAISYGAGGNVRWIKQSSGSPPPSGSSISVNKQGGLNLIGGFWKTTTIDSFTITGGGSGMFVGLMSQLPELRIDFNQGSAAIRWSANSSGYALERADTLPSSNWSLVTNGVEVIGEDFVVKPGREMASGFFRLRRR